MFVGAAEDLAARSDDPRADPKWTGWVELGGYHDFDDGGRGELAIFGPLWQSAIALAFADLRGKLFEDDVQEGNFALGFRRMRSKGWNLGVWLGTDVRSTDDNNKFWQVSGGIEALHPNFDFRVNGYVPLTDPKSSPSLAEVAISGNQILLTGGEEVPLYGVDAEVGVRVPLEKMGRLDSKSVELRLYGGGFYFDADEAFDKIAGPKARVELRLNDIIPHLPGSRLTAEYEYSYDDVREDRHEIGARLRIPFGGISASDDVTRLSSLNAQEQRMMEGLERDTDIVTNKSKEELVEDAFTNVDIDKVAFVKGGGDISTTSTAQGDKTLIIVNGAIAGEQTLQSDQTLQGGGSTIQVRGRTSGTVANFKAPGSAATLSGRLNLNSRGHAAGLVINTAAVDGIQVVAGSDKVLIEQTEILNPDDGIDIKTGSSNIAIKDVTISDAVEGIVIGDDGAGNSNISNVEIANTTIARTDALGEGIDVANGVTNLTIDTVTMTDIGDDGIEMEGGNQAVIRNVTMTVKGEGIEIGGAFGANTVDISDVTITYDGNGEGIRLAPGGPGDTVNILRTTITKNGAGVVGSAIDLDQANSVVTITDSTIVGAGEDGLQITPAGITVTMNNTTFSGAFGDDLIDIFLAATTVSGSGNIDNSTAGTFCEVPGGVTGTFVFTSGTSCPP